MELEKVPPPPHPPRKEVTVVVDGLSYSVGSRLLLDNVSLCARPGELLAIVGPSGSGKTTLLNVIAKRAVASNVTSGSVRFNGHLATKRDIRRDFNYVMTHDKMLPYLTVYETLVYAVALKLPGRPEEERLQRVETLIQQFALDRCRDTIVGGEWRKGLSSGEMKRLAIACELVDDPAVLILDEPTSGLDSCLSCRVLQLLLGEARRGRTIICTVHQPPSEVFALFDRFLLLTAGRVAFHGPVDRAADFFAAQGLVRAKDWAPCDYYLELVSEVTDASLALAADEDEQGSAAYSPTKYRLSAEQKRELLAAWEASEDAALLKSDIAAAVAAGTKAEEEVNGLRGDDSFSRGRKLKNWGAQWWIEFSTLTKRSFKNTLRNPLAAIVAILVQAMQGLILGGIFYRTSIVHTGDKPEPLLAATFWDNSFVQAFTHGIDGQGAHPLLAMWEQGVDGSGSYVIAGGGNRTVEHAKKAATFLFSDVASCMYETYKLSDSYPPIPELDTVPKPAVWEEWTPKRVYQVLMMWYQWFDSQWPTAQHPGLDLTFTNLCHAEALKYNPVDPLAFYTCFMAHGKPLFDPMLACLNLPPLPDAGTRRLLLEQQEGRNADPSAVQPEARPSLTVSVAGEERVLNEEEKERLSMVAERSKGDGAESPAAPRRNLVTFGTDQKTKQAFEDFLGPELMTILNSAKDLWKRVTECSEPLCGSLMTWRRFFEDFATQTLDTVSSMLSFSGCLFFVATVLGFASYDALLTFPQERALYNRESANGMYRSSSYYLAKNVADFPFQIVPCFVLVTLFYLLVGFDLTLRQVAVYWLISVLICHAAYGFAYFVSALAPRMEVALLVAPLTLMVWLVVAGFFLRDGDVPLWINWFKYLSLYRYAFFALCCNQFPLGRYFGTLPNAVNLALSGVTYTSLWGNIGLLFALGVVWRVCGFFALHYTNRRLGLEA